MSGPFKLAAVVIAAGVLAFGAQAQNQQQKNQPRPQGQLAPVQRRPGIHVGDWIRKNAGKPFDQQKRSLESDPDYKKASPEQQQHYQQMLQHFNSLSPDKQQHILQRIDKFEHMTPQQRAQARALSDRIRMLPEERRFAVRQQIRSMAGMPPEQRQKIFVSDQYNQQFSTEERDLVQRGLDLRDQAGLAQGPDESAPPDR